MKAASALNDADNGKSLALSLESGHIFIVKARNS